MKFYNTYNYEKGYSNKLSSSGFIFMYLEDIFTRGSHAWDRINSNIIGGWTIYKNYGNQKVTFQRWGNFRSPLGERRGRINQAAQFQTSQIYEFSSIFSNPFAKNLFPHHSLSGNFMANRFWTLQSVLYPILP